MMTLSTERIREIKILVMILAAVLCLLLLKTDRHQADAAPVPAGSETCYTMYVVQAGDTLWDIAQTRLTDAFPSCRSYAGEVMRANGMKNSIIYPGDLLMIPVPASSESDTVTVAATP